MAKIGIDARMYGKVQSGIGTYIQQLTAHLFALDKNNEYYLFLLDQAFTKYKTPNHNVHKIKTAAYWYSYAEQTKFLWQLNKFNFDLMHFPHFNAPIFYNKLRITTIHDITPKFFPGHKQKSWYRKKAYELTIKSSLKKSAKIFTISQNTKNDLIKYFKVTPEKIAVTYLGIEPQFKKITDYAKIKEIKAKYGITKPYLFFISTWRNHKNFQGLIKAFSILKNKYKLDYQLVLGGLEDPHYPNISQTINKSEHKKDIITPGFISDQELPLFYNAAEIFIIPSYYEGFGIIGLEAMACETPVISSKITSLPEILGEAAIYFDPHNPAEIAQKAKEVITNQELKNQLINKGLEQTKKYSWQKCAQETFTLYQKIINQ